MLSISVGSVEDIVKYQLHYRKVIAQWVPRTLTDVNKMVRMQAASHLLQQFEDEGDAVLKSIVTTDETWVHYFIPESQQSSYEWRHTSSPKPKRAQRSRLAGKVMATFFWDWQGVIHVDLLTDARTFNAVYYSDLLATYVKENIRSKRKTGGKRVAFLQCTPPYSQNNGNLLEIEMQPSDTSAVQSRFGPKCCSEGSNQTYKACSLWMMQLWFKKNQSRSYLKCIPQV
ncbi:hypothetical protein B7P43_G05809 [Cryptotermes secundus]|uniref:Uncharacterized protein n=1 Tax=Cryptotermes secundus TaxID=105785 RepID=A0A2J7PUL5_9NEOP|nr:hypothetical protein B7P43_G05809 [Cryptotermes secundus]